MSESNRRPFAYKAIALPTELNRHNIREDYLFSFFEQEYIFPVATGFVTLRLTVLPYPDLSKATSKPISKEQPDLRALLKPRPE